MLTRTIPSSGESLPVIGLGTYKGFDVRPNSAQRESLGGVLRSLFAAGGSVVDSSPMYGRAEETAGALISEQRACDNAFIATKIWTQGRKSGLDQMNRSMELLRCEPIDLMQVHNLLDWRTHLATLRAWKEEGRVRYVGITHYSSSAHAELEKIMRAEALDFVQLNYSIEERDAARRLLPLAETRGIAIIVNLPFGAGGLLRSARGKPVPMWMREAGCETWPQALLKYVLANQAVTCVIPGTGNPKHMAENCQAGLAPMLDAALCKRLEALWDSQ